MTDDLQRTADWRQDRSGLFTASVMIDIAARNESPGKNFGNKLASFDDRVWRVVTERIANRPMDSVSSRSLQWGTEVESFAIERYELETGLIVTPSGFVKHPKYPFAGASPDGLIGDVGSIEAKCPVNESIHLRRFVEGMPKEIRFQVQTVMWVCNREWCDFLSADPRQAEKFQFLKIRVYRDEKLIQQIEESVIEAEAAAQELQSILMRIAA